MGYWSNGTEGRDWEGQWCDRCVHMPPNPDDGGCPVMLLHSLWNYEQCRDGEAAEAKKTALEALIPTDREKFTNTCKMFIERKETI